MASDAHEGLGTSGAAARRRHLTDTIESTHRLALGMTVLPREACWLDIDEELDADLGEKRRLLHEHRAQVLVELPASRPAQQETLQLVASSLATAYPERFELAEDELRRRDRDETIALQDFASPPLERASLCVQEDLCLVESRPEGWCLTAACVCFPTRWDLPSKLARPLGAIHARVPGYHERLEEPTDRFFDGIKPGRVYRRANWSLVDDPALFQPTDKLRIRPRSEIDSENAGESVWLRVEHQTLQRLPETGAMLFSIRVHRMALAELARDVASARRLLAAMDSMSPEMQAYKSLAAVRDATAGYLERRVAETAARRE